MIAEFVMVTALAAAAPAATAKPPPAAAAQPTIEDYCKTRNCRHDVDVTLRDATGKTLHMQRKLVPPAVEPEMVNVLPGETVEAVAEFKGGKFSGWRTPTPKDGSDAIRISIEFKQDAQGPGMSATVRNAGPKGVKLTMGLVRAEPGARPEGTSSCPLVPKGSSHESCPFPVGNLLLRDVRILSPSEKVACE
jgi:hypothetical protein